MSKLTRETVVATSGAGPVVNEQTIYSRLAGAPGGFHKISYTAAHVFTVIPVKDFSMLTANAAGAATRVYVKSNSWVTDGMTLTIGGNAIVAETKVVATPGTGEELSSTGQKLYWIEFTTGLANPMTTAAYSLVCSHDAPIVGSALTTGQKLYDWLNTDPAAKLVLGSKKESTYTGTRPTTIAAATLMKEIATWGANTAGTSPKPALTDFTDFITDMDASAWDDFIQVYDDVPRLFYVVDPTNTVHEAMRNWAIAKRSSTTPGDYSIKVLTGCAWGDVVVASGTTTSPTFRAQAIDNQDVVLVANGFNWQAAYLSHAAAVFGMIVAGGVNHNLTQDRYVGIMAWEAKWNERALGELTTLHKYGVLTNRLAVDNSGSYWVVSQGLSTLQANSVSWNPDATTPLIQQRDLQDFVKRDLDFVLVRSQLGQDETDRNSITSALVARATGYHYDNGFIEDGTYKITSTALDPSGAGWVVGDTYRLPTTVDWITTVHRVLVGE
ncbi:MAG: hypothetical protein WC911_01950 [Thermoleophilia bacterium]